VCSGCLQLSLFLVPAGLMPGLTLGSHSGQVSTLSIPQGLRYRLVENHDDAVTAFRDGGAKSVPLFLAQELFNQLG